VQQALQVLKAVQIRRRKRAHWNQRRRSHDTRT